MQSVKKLLSAIAVGNVRSIIIDWLLIISILSLLTLLHIAVPESVKSSMELNHENLSLINSWTAAFIHYSNMHLIGNSIGFLLGVSYTWWVAQSIDEKSWFRRTFVALVIFLPPLVSISSHLILSSVMQSPLPPERGFSGVASGFGGFLLVAIGVYISNQHSRMLGFQSTLAVIILLTVEFYFIYTDHIDFLILGMAILGIAIQFIGYFRRNPISKARTLLSKDNRTPLILVIVVIMTLVIFMNSMFPANPVESGTFTNIVAHGAGFILGFVVSIFIYMSPKLLGNNIILITFRM